MKTYQFRPAQLDRTGAARARQYAIGQYLSEEAPNLTPDALDVSVAEHANAAGKTMWWDVTVQAKPQAEVLPASPVEAEAVAEAHVAKG